MLLSKPGVIPNKPSVTRGSRAAFLAPETDTLGPVLLILIVLTLVRLVALQISRVDLFFDESQYWAWSRELSFGYFSKPPLLAWLIWGAGHVCGDTEACIRSAAPLLNLGTSLAAFAIASTLYDSRTAFWAAMLVAFGTGSVFSTRIISTDVPMVFFWSVALLAYVHLLFRSDWRWAALLGVAIGGGTLSKYAMLYFPIGMVVAAAIEPRARALLAKAEMLIALGAAAVLVAPNLIWNASHGFITIRYAGANVSGEPFEPSIVRPLAFLAEQFAVFGPVVFAVALRCFPTIASNKTMPEDRVLLAFAICPLLAVTAVSVGVHAYANWAAASFVSLAVLAAAVLVRENYRWLLRASLALGVAAQLTFIVTDVFAARIRLPFRASNPYSATLGWAALSRTVGELARKRDIKTIVTDRRAYFASLLYYWRDQPENVVSWPNDDLPFFWPSHALTATSPQPILLVTDCPDIDRLANSYFKVKSLGGFATKDNPAPRFFYAFELEDPRRSIDYLPQCPS
jgi:4-amino-4-deoxy-L-arabinose transferase-like glycosyltransferase